MAFRFKAWLRALAYHSGALRAWHRVVNRQRLTVFMFHRVLPADSAEFALAEREYTFSADGFARCVDFIAQHYQPISLEMLREFAEGRAALPSCPALVTFDDGWRDTLTVAGPILHARGVPSVVFVAGEILALECPRWWQDALACALVHPDAVARLRGLPLLQAHLPEGPPTRDWILTVFARVAGLPEDQRDAVAAAVAPISLATRQMLSAADLPDLTNVGISLGAHGYTHAPLTHSPDPVRELVDSLAVLTTQGVPVASMAFPHGACTTELVAQARAAGFELVFDSEAALVDVSERCRLPKSLPRLHVPENDWTCEHGIVSPPKLATFLFIRPTAGPSQ